MQETARLEAGEQDRRGDKVRRTCCPPLEHRAAAIEETLTFESPTSATVCKMGEKIESMSATVRQIENRIVNEEVSSIIYQKKE